eukprot:scaffold26152_cov126-Isochrysis_galbana.AAC.5
MPIARSWSAIGSPSAYVSLSHEEMRASISEAVLSSSCSSCAPVIAEQDSSSLSRMRFRAMRPDLSHRRRRLSLASPPIVPVPR